PFLRQRPGILDLLLADLAEARILSLIILVRCLAFEDAARAPTLSERRVFRIIGQLGLFFGIEVIEVAEELVEAIDGWQRIVTVADVVLSKLPRRISQAL